MRCLDLFSGIGGFALGLESVGMHTIGFCEIEPFPRAVLAHHWPGVPIHDDVRTLSAESVPWLRVEAARGIDLICGGFPCVDISSAGKKVGIGGQKSGLWKELARLVGEIRPRYVLVENVSALLARGMGDVLGDLAALGYDAEWHCIPAAALGAPHIRERVWLLGYPHADGKPDVPFDDEASRLSADAPNSQCRLESLGWLLARTRGEQELDARHAIGEWPNPPSDLGMDDGLPYRLDRLRSLGNSVVPAVVALIGQAILEADEALR